jgi:hypothetical protein
LTSAELAQLEALGRKLAAAPINVRETNEVPIP